MWRGTESTGPLAGLRVVDLSRALAGPYASMMLADAGADVVKVERPGSGDDARHWGPPFAGPEDNTDATYFLSVNRSKRSIVLDLKSEADHTRLCELVREADVLIENFRDGVMERLGLGPEVLRGLNERLIVLSITGFGVGGPDGHRAGFDMILQGEAGLMGMTGPPGGPPMRVGFPITDITAGMFGAYGVLAALHDRERTSKGQRVTTSLLAAGLAIHTFHGTRWTVAGELPQKLGNMHPTIAPYGTFEGSDGYLNLAVGSEGLWQRFAEAVGLDPDDARFRTNGLRVANRSELEAQITSQLRSGTVEDWIARLEERGVPAGRIRDLDDVYAWEQVRHLGLIESVIHPVAGPIELAGTPLRWSHSGRPQPQAPPLLGQHNADLLPQNPTEGAHGP